MAPGSQPRPSRLWHLPFPAILALRYLKSTRRDAFVTFLSAVAGLGLALGVAALILSLGALTGFQTVLVNEVRQRSPQIEVELAPGSDGEEALRQVLALPGVQGAQRVVRGGGWLLGPGRRSRAVELVGFGGRVPSSFAEAAGSSEGLYLPRDVAASWGLEVGTTLEVASPRPTLTPFGPQPRVRSLPLAGTFRLPSTGDEPPRVALPLAVAQSLLGRSGDHLEVDAGGYERAAALASRLADALPAGSRVKTWREINGPLFFVLRLEKGMIFVAVFLIVLVAALALVADLSLLIASKGGEIGILGTMGAAPGALRRAFLLLGAALAVGGVTLGALLGVSVAEILDRYRLLPVPRGVYFLDYVPFAVRGVDLLVILGAALCVALVFARWAAGRATALAPVEALRR